MPERAGEVDTDLGGPLEHGRHREVQGFDSPPAQLHLPYVRRQWTGEVRQFGAQCPSCLAFHAPSYIGCNGLREPSTRRCEAVLGEIRCDRPDNHLDEHQALSDVLRVAWSVTL